MFIKSIELENWKCFSNKKVLNFQKYELNSRNGTGKRNNC